MVRIASDLETFSEIIGISKYIKAVACLMKTLFRSTWREHAMPAVMVHGVINLRVVRYASTLRWEKSALLDKNGQSHLEDGELHYLKVAAILKNDKLADTVFIISSTRRVSTKPGYKQDTRLVKYQFTRIQENIQEIC